MIVSSFCIFGARSASVPSTAAAGTMSHAARGGFSFATKSSSEVAPTAPSFASAAIASALRSYTTHVWPFFIRRRTMLAPMRPRPIIPSCIAVSFSGWGQNSVTRRGPGKRPA